MCKTGCGFCKDFCLLYGTGVSEGENADLCGEVWEDNSSAGALCGCCPFPSSTTTAITSTRIETYNIKNPHPQKTAPRKKKKNPYSSSPAPGETPGAVETPGVKPIEGPSGSSAKTPAPFLGILAGLGAAAVVFGLRRK